MIGKLNPPVDPRIWLTGLTFKKIIFNLSIFEMTCINVFLSFKWKFHVPAYYYALKAFKSIETSIYSIIVS